MTDDKTRSGLGLTSLIVGVVSIFTFQILIIPFLAIIFGGIALSKFDPERQKGRWMAVVGLALGVVYALLGSLRLLGY